MGRRVSLAMSQDVRGRTRHDGKTKENVGPERQVDSGTDWPVRPQMQPVAPITNVGVHRLCNFFERKHARQHARDSETDNSTQAKMGCSPVEAILSQRCVDNMQNVDGSISCLTSVRCSSGKLGVRHCARLID